METDRRVVGDLEPLSADGLVRLNRRAISDPAAIREIMVRAHEARVGLYAGMDSRNGRRTARIKRVTGGLLRLETENISLSAPAPLYFQFEVSGTMYFFLAAADAAGKSTIHLPRVLYQAERRELPRTTADPGTEVELRDGGGTGWVGHVADSSYQGLGISVVAPARAPENPFSIHMNGSSNRSPLYGQLRNAAIDGERQRWGVLVSTVPFGPLVPIARSEGILPDQGGGRLRRTLAFAGAAARALPSRLALRGKILPSVPVVEYRNSTGHPVRAIVDRTCDGTGGTAVVIPPAWGRTKETLLPLAETLLASFRSAGEPLTVVRFDGTFRRGESYVPPDCRRPGRESVRFTFSQGVDDILSTADYVQHRYRPDRIILVTFSLASIEGRRAVALNPGGRLSGWVCVVGMGDLQSGLRAVSGGIDYGYGLLSGVRFGVHKLGGVSVDMDNAGRDVMANKLGFLEDSRRDFARIKVPVTWVHGRHDGWIDIERVRLALSAGDTGNRRLIEVPTGHQLRNSRDALETFQLVSCEVAKIAIGRGIGPVLPDLAKLEGRSTAERARVRQHVPDLRAFWRRYLTGDENHVGMELLTATSAYQKFMARQIELLSPRPGRLILDLGAGVGDLAVSLLNDEQLCSDSIRVLEIDYVLEALQRGRRRAKGRRSNVTRIVADLARSIPLPDESVDAAVASLVLSYVPEPAAVLSEIKRTMKPGAILVASVPRRDADLSQLYARGLVEFSPERIRQRFGTVVEGEFESIQREFLNSGAQLLTLEELGAFRFWEPEEFAQLLSDAGFVHVSVERALGDPGQAVLASAQRS